jgi:hypothetical protein
VTDPNLVRLPNTGNFSTVKLIPPGPTGFVLLAVEVDHRPPFAYFLESKAKARLLADLKVMLNRLRMAGFVIEATLLKTTLIPPGRGSYIKNDHSIHIARFDVAILFELASLEEAKTFFMSRELDDIGERMSAVAKSSYRMVGENIRRIGPVDHRRPGVFLINYFCAANDRQNLAVWEYTAGWFQDETALDNSVLLRPIDQAGARYTIVNHCRWNRMRDVLPSLLLKPSFRRYVLRHFEANNTAAMPVFYRLA